MSTLNDSLTLKDLIKMLEGFDEVEQMTINATLADADASTKALRTTQRNEMRSSLQTLLRYMGLHYHTVNDAAQALERIAERVESIVAIAAVTAESPALERVIHVTPSKLRELVDAELLDLVRARAHHNNSADQYVEKLYTEVTKVMTTPRAWGAVLSIVNASESVTGAAIRNIRGAYVSEIRSAKLLAMIALTALNEYRSRNSNWRHGWDVFARGQFQRIPDPITTSND